MKAFPSRNSFACSPLLAHTRESIVDNSASCSTAEIKKSEILIVDDSPVQRALLSHLLKSCGYSVVEATDGVQALNLLKQGKIRIVFTDWIMPNMSGIELIEKIREENLGFYVYVILCSCKNSKTDVIAGVRMGADDFLTKPAIPEELFARLHAGERVIKLQNKIAEEEQKVARAYASLSKAHQKLRSDLDAAAKLQLSLLPHPASLSKIHFDWVFRPTNEVAGDTFNVFQLDATHIGFYQLDVSGHGIPSAMLSFYLSKILQGSPLRDSFLKRPMPQEPFYRIVPPDEVVSDLNKRFQNEEDMFFTIIYGVLNTLSGKLQFTQAGHPNPILCRPHSPTRLLGNTGFPVGALPNIEFELVEEQLLPGDRVILCSDGITECINDHNEQFGISRMTECVKAAEDQQLRDFVGGFVESLTGWRGHDEFDDDISLLVMEYESAN